MLTASHALLQFACSCNWVLLIFISSNQCCILIGTVSTKDSSKFSAAQYIFCLWNEKVEETKVDAGRRMKRKGEERGERKKIIKRKQQGDKGKRTKRKEGGE